MKIPKDTRKRRRRLVMIGLAFLLIVAGSVATYAYINKSSQSNPKKTPSITDKATDEQIDSGTVIKENTVNDSKPISTESNAGKNSSSPSNTSNEVAVTITSPTEQTNGVFNVRAFINRSTTDGSCSASLSRQGQSSAQATADGMQPQSNISACKTLIIDTSSLEKGNWKLSVMFKNNAGLSGVATQDVILK